MTPNCENAFASDDAQGGNIICRLVDALMSPERYSIAQRNGELFIEAVAPAAALAAFGQLTAAPPCPIIAQ